MGSCAPASRSRMVFTNCGTRFVTFWEQRGTGPMLPSPRPAFCREQDARGFVQGLFIFPLRDRIGDDARAHAETHHPVRKNGGADGDVELALAVESEIADGPRIKAARGLLDLRDDLAGAFLRGAGDRAARETRAQRRDVVDVRTQPAFDLRDEVEDLLVTLQPQEFAHGDASEFADRPEIVAFEVGYHYQFRDLLRRGEKIVGGLFIRIRFAAPGPGALDRTRDDLPPAHAQEQLGRRGEDGPPFQVQVSGIRRGGIMTERFVEIPRIAGKRGSELVGKIDLVDVPRRDVILRPPHPAAKLPARHLRFEKQARVRRRSVRNAEWELALSHPSSVTINERIIIKTEPEASVVIHPARGEPGGESVVGQAGPLARRDTGGKTPPRLFRMTGDDLRR